MEKMVATLVIAAAVFVLNQMGIDIGGSGSSGSKVKPLKEKSVEQLLDEVRVLRQMNTLIMTETPIQSHIRKLSIKAESIR